MISGSIFFFTDLPIGTCPFFAVAARPPWHSAGQLRSATFPPPSSSRTRTDSCPASDDNITFLSTTDHLEKARDKARPPVALTK